jgi:hypothetical protein
MGQLRGETEFPPGLNDEPRCLLRHATPYLIVARTTLSKNHLRINIIA